MSEKFPSKIGKSIAMVVDDVKDNRTLVKTMVGMISPGLHVVEAEDGHEAVVLYKDLTKKGHRISRILIDNNMPKMKGEDALREICSFLQETKGTSLQQCETKAVIVTADERYSTKGPCERGSQCDNCVTSEVIAKPVELEDLCDFLDGTTIASD